MRSHAAMGSPIRAASRRRIGGGLASHRRTRLDAVRDDETKRLPRRNEAARPWLPRQEVARSGAPSSLGLVSDPIDPCRDLGREVPGSPLSGASSFCRSRPSSAKIEGSIRRARTDWLSGGIARRNAHPHYFTYNDPQQRGGDPKVSPMPGRVPANQRLGRQASCISLVAEQIHQRRRQGKSSTASA